MEEFMSAWIRFYTQIIDCCSHTLKLYSDQFIKFYGKNMDGFDVMNDHNNINFFNGYLRGYEAALKDYKQHKPHHQDPADIYF